MTLGADETRPAPPGRSPGRSSGRATALAWVVCLLAVVFCASARILGTLNDPNFDREEAAGLLRSDPGLLYYITERILEADGGIPDDFHADPNVQHPDRVDLARMFTVGEEFLVAWGYRAYRGLGGEEPLHVFCVAFLSVLAALTVLGVFGIVRELSGSHAWAAVAAVLYVGIPVNFRTTGFILIREDLSFPLFAAHAWALARLWRRPSVATAVVAGLLLTAALATWHAMGFIVALELAAVTAWFLWSGVNPFVRRPAWILFAVVAVTSLAVPVLRAKLFLLSIPAALATTLALLALLRPGRGAPRPSPGVRLRRGAVWAVACAAILLGSALVGRLFEGGGDYGHVVALLSAKLAHLGQLPADPRELPFDVRLLWQGPFSSALLEDLTLGMPHALLAAGFAFAAGGMLARRGRLGADLGVPLAFLALGLASGLLIRRTLILPGFAAPIALAVAWRRLGHGERAGRWVVAALGLVGAGLVSLGLSRAPLGWYAPPQRNAEIRALVHWVDENVPPGAAILGDFVASTAVLAHSRNPIALQPKYETAETRRRIERFYETFVRGTPEELRGLARELECDYLLIDTAMLWWTGRYILGVPIEQQVPDTGTCAYYFVNRNPAALEGVPGFELLYRSPPALGLDLFRVYRVQ